MSIKRLCLAFVASLVLLLTFSCARESSDGTINIALSSSPITFDTQRNSTLAIRLIMVGNVYEKLLTIDSEGNPRPELCSSYRFSDNMHTLTFHLRENVPFHNGKIMDSEDVSASLNRWLSVYRAADRLVSGARFVAKGNTVVIHADSSLYYLPAMLSSSPQSAVIMPRACAEDLDANGFVKEYIGTGPYRFAAFTPDQSVRLEKFDDYAAYGKSLDGLWGLKSAPSPALVYHFVRDGAARTMGLETGLYDAMNDVMKDDMPRLAENKALVIHDGESAGSFAIVYNKKQGPCAKGYFRQAIHIGIDWAEIMRACYGNSGFELSHQAMESWQKNWMVDAEAVALSREKAKQILQENGYQGEVVKILSANVSNMDKSAVAMQSELAKLGVPSEVIIVDWSTMMSYREDPQRFDLFVTAFSAVPIPQLKLYLDPSYPGWSEDETLSALVSALSDAESLKEAASCWQSLSRYLDVYLPVDIAGHYRSGYGWRLSLEGVIAYQGLYFWNAKKVLQ